MARKAKYFLVGKNGRLGVESASFAGAKKTARDLVKSGAHSFVEVHEDTHGLEYMLGRVNADGWSAV